MKKFIKIFHSFMFISLLVFSSCSVESSNKSLIEGKEIEEIRDKKNIRLPEFLDEYIPGFGK